MWYGVAILGVFVAEGYDDKLAVSLEFCGPMGG